MTVTLNQRWAEPSQTPGNQAHTESAHQNPTELEHPSSTQFYYMFVYTLA